MRNPVFLAIALTVAFLVFLAVHLFGNDYVFFAGYTVVQFIVLGTAWNILGGYCGYVNFGTAAFFALGAYTSVFFHKTYPLPIPLLLVIAAGVSGLVGLGTGYLTLRLRGAFFSIATLALAVVLQTFVVNWNYVGGARRLRDPAERRRHPRLPPRLRAVSLPHHCLPRPDRDHHRARDRALAARLRLRHHPRRRARRRGLRRADAQAQADRDHALGRADGNGWCAVSVLHRGYLEPASASACPTRSTRSPCRWSAAPRPGSAR